MNKYQEALDKIKTMLIVVADETQYGINIKVEPLDQTQTYKTFERYFDRLQELIEKETNNPEQPRATVKIR